VVSSGGDDAEHGSQAKSSVAAALLSTIALAENEVCGALLDTDKSFLFHPEPDAIFSNGLPPSDV
jgi:hypothetical protein